MSDDPKTPKRKRAAQPRPEHYKIVCISLYTDDRKLATDMVAELKRRGHTQMSLSRLVRIALRQIDIDALDIRLGEGAPQ